MNKFKQFLAIFLAVIMFVGVVPVGAITVAAEDGVPETIYVLAGSDFQESNYDANGDGKTVEHEASAQNVANILVQISKKYETMDGFLFAGDYADESNSSSKSKSGVQALLAAVKDTYANLGVTEGNDMNTLLVQGNHDPKDTGFNTTGGYDFNGYSVYLINEDDYPEYGGTKSAVQTTADNLKAWLTERENQTAPIFVISHLPIAYSTRSYKNGDGKYGKLIFDVLNEAGANGQNIIYLCGHNHTRDYDSYIGGEAIYLPVGDTIQVNNLGKSDSWSDYTLNFTYMTAGYVGYYNEIGYNSSNRDDTKLTMTVFAITGDKVTVERYSADGLYNLKSKGVDGGRDYGTVNNLFTTDFRASHIGLSINETVYTSPQTIQLKGVSAETEAPTDAATDAATEAETEAPVVQVKDEETGISIAGQGASGFDVMPLTVEDSLLSAYHLKRCVAFDFTVPGFKTGSKATVGIPVPAGWDMNAVGAYYINGSTLERLPTVVQNGVAYFSTTHFSGYLLGEEEGGVLRWVEIPGDTIYSGKITSLSDGDKVIIQSNDVTTYYLSSSVHSSTMLALTSSSSTPSQTTGVVEVWTVEVDDDGTYLRNSEGKYLSIPADGQAVMTDTRNALTVRSITKSNQPTWDIADTTTTYSWATASIGNTTGLSSYLDGSYYYKDGNDYYVITDIDRTSSGGIGFPNYNWTITYTIPGSDEPGTANATTNNWSSLTVYHEQANTSTMYLNQYGGRSYDRAAGYYQNGSSNNGSTWNFYTVTYYNDTYAAFTPAVFRYPIGTFETTAQVEDVIRNLITVYVSNYADGTDKTAVTDYALTAGSSYDPTVATSDSGVDYTITYNGVNLGRVNVVIYDKTPVSISVDKDAAAVYRKSIPSTKTGVTVTVTYDDDSTETIDLTVGMLSGEDFDINVSNEEGKYYTTTVNYNGLSVDGFKLTVLPLPNEVDYPEYPNEGAVHINKKGEGIDFQSSGIAKIELSAAGLPYKTGTDLIIMLDTSSSMNQFSLTYTNEEGKSVTETRLEIMKKALKNIVRELSSYQDGSEADFRIAIADFNGYSAINANDKMTNSVQEGVNYGQVYTGTKTVDYGAFQQASTILDSTINAIEYHSGTNYDYAFETIYRLATASKEYGEENNENRNTYVIFMSDGTPFQFNYYMTVSTYGHVTNNDWSAWLTGTFDTTSSGSNTYFKNSSHKYFYNPGTVIDPSLPEGSQTVNVQKHWMAEAIKGTGTFTVIDNGDLPNATPISDMSYMYEVPGLGLTMYTIGYCLRDDQQTNGSYGRDVASSGALWSTTSHVIKYLASTDEDGNFLYYEADTPNDLNTVFSSIAGEIRVAGNDAAFIDKMGDDYDLRTASESYRYTDYTTQTTTTKTINPEIRVLRYKTYRKNEVGLTVNGHLVTLDDVGLRYGTPIVLETVTFSADGTKAYSDLNEAGVNIFGSDGIIRANRFMYNTTGTDYALNIDVDHDGVNDVLPSESFYWYIGDIIEEEVVLEYYVYLTDSMEDPGCPAGAYPTNEYATLYYINWLQHPAHLDTVSPILPWQQAIVNYAFYLVDADGNPVVNQSTGEIGSFANRVVVSNPRKYADILLNTSSTDLSAEVLATAVVPMGYTLYDPNAAYDIQLASDGGGRVVIIKGDGKNATTYIDDYGGTATTVSPSGDEIDPYHDYSHTTVWFAVLFELKCVPDTVVIDYGKPVDIQALINDRFGNYGTLIAIGKRTSDVPTSTTERRDAVPEGFGKNLTLDFGTAAIKSSSGGVVTYTIGGMKMTDAESFAYAVLYRDPDNADNPNNGYYFADITVVPATIIYYEDTFVAYEGDWSVVNSGTPVANQAEDRPGDASVNPENADADNVYGYDAGYHGYIANPSNASQHVTTVYEGMSAWPTASFTFTGTGFDLIALTDSLQGFATIEVFDPDGKLVTYDEYDVYAGEYEADASWGVNNYYGYKSVEVVGYVKYMCRYTDSWHVETEIVTEKSLKPGEIEVGVLPATGEAGKVYVMYDYAYDWTENDQGTLYQIPVMKSKNALPYGTYTVVVTPMYTSFYDHDYVKDAADKTVNSYNFVIDAIRIYDPAGVHEIAGYETNVNKYYLADNEAWPQFIELRDVILGQDAFSASTTASGAAFVDAFAKSGTVSDYNNFGPNNEVYLAPNQSVIFRLKADATNIAAVHMATKCVNGAVSYTVNGTAMTADSATDLYYDITELIDWNDDVSDLITITNTGSSIQSITNLKITFKSMPDTAAALTLAAADVAEALAQIENVTFGSDVEFDTATLLHWYKGQQLTVGNAAYRKAPQYMPNAQYASTDIIPLVNGETNVVNLGKYNQYTSARVLWVDANGIVIGSTASFSAGEDVDVNALATNGTKVGAVGYMLTVTLAQSASYADAAFNKVSADTVLHGPVATEAPTEPATEPVVPEEPEEDTSGWQKGVTAAKTLRKKVTLSASAVCAVSDVIDYTSGTPCYVNLGKYDQYTSARVLYVDANGYVIGATASFNAGKLVNIDTLALNGTRKGAVGIVLSVTLCKSASTASAAFDTVVNNTVITDSTR